MVATVGLMISGCASSLPADEQIVGTWSYDWNESEHPVGGGSIEFRDDGTFYAIDVPGDLLLHAAPDGEAEGTWTIVERRSGVTNPSVELTLPGVRVDLEVYGSGSDMRLFSWLQDPDDFSHTYDLKRE